MLSSRRRRSTALPSHAACREGHGCRAVRRLVQPAACRPCAGRRDRAEAAGARPALVDRHTRQSVEVEQRADAARRAAEPFRGDGENPRIKVTAFEAAPSSALHGRHAGAGARRIPASTSSGSWAPTTCATSIAGSAGAEIARPSRSRSSTGRARRSPSCRRWWRRRSTMPASTRPMRRGSRG